MKKNQFLLLKLIEECAEVAHRASKQIQFGKHEVQKNQSDENGERLRDELLDLFAVAHMLEIEQEIPDILHEDFVEAEINKKEKLQKYLNVSATLGQLPEIKL